MWLLCPESSTTFPWVPLLLWFPGQRRPKEEPWEICKVEAEPLAYYCLRDTSWSNMTVNRQRGTWCISALTYSSAPHPGCLPKCWSCDHLQSGPPPESWQKDRGNHQLPPPQFNVCSWAHSLLTLLHKLQPAHLCQALLEWSGRFPLSSSSSFTFLTFISWLLPFCVVLIPEHSSWICLYDWCITDHNYQES